MAALPVYITSLTAPSIGFCDPAKTDSLPTPRKVLSCLDRIGSGVTAKIATYCDFRDLMNFELVQANIRAYTVQAWTLIRKHHYVDYDWFDCQPETQKVLREVRNELTDEIREEERDEIRKKVEYERRTNTILSLALNDYLSRKKDLSEKINYLVQKDPNLEALTQENINKIAELRKKGLSEEETEILRNYREKCNTLKSALEQSLTIPFAEDVSRRYEYLIKKFKNFGYYLQSNISQMKDEILENSEKRFKDLENSILQAKLGGDYFIYALIAIDDLDTDDQESIQSIINCSSLAIQANVTNVVCSLPIDLMIKLGHISSCIELALQASLKGDERPLESLVYRERLNLDTIDRIPHKEKYPSILFYLSKFTYHFQEEEYLTKSLELYGDRASIKVLMSAFKFYQSKNRAKAKEVASKILRLYEFTINDSELIKLIDCAGIEKCKAESMYDCRIARYRNLKISVPPELLRAAAKNKKDLGKNKEAESLFNEANDNFNKEFLKTDPALLLSILNKMNPQFLINHK